MAAAIPPAAAGRVAAGRDAAGRVAAGPLRIPIEPRVADAANDAAALRRKTAQVSKGAARAAVLGVNDGLVSNLLIILGIAGADAAPASVRLAGFASLLAGAISMAAGEWISVRSQVELYGGVLAEIRMLIARNPKLVLGELVHKLVDAGLDQRTAQQASTELPLDGDKFMSFTARTVFGLDPDELGSPVTAAVSSLGLFAAGALVPLAPWFFVHGALAVALSVTVTALASAAVGVVVARSSGGRVARGALRQLAIVVGVAAITFVIGKLFGTAVG